jgi:GDP-L-fucose synthase
MKAPILITGARGMVGSAIVACLGKDPAGRLCPSRLELDLRDQQAVTQYFKDNRPQTVFHIAAKVGGIEANRKDQAGFMYENLMIQANVCQAAHLSGVTKLLTLGSSCMYPRECPQPMKEEYLLTGALEPTNEGYAIAKIAGSRMAQFYHSQYGDPFISAIPCNLYGEHDNFDPKNSHVLSAFVRRFVEAAHSKASSVTLWGTGCAYREFLHVQDLADALILLMKRYDSAQPINVGAGTDISIFDLAHLVSKIAGFEGEILWDSSMPDGMPRKLMDSSKIQQLGWKPKISLEDGITRVVNSYRSTRLKAS